MAPRPRLAVMTTLSIAAVNRSSPRTSTICLGIYGLGIGMTPAMAALHIQPYRGPDALVPGILGDLRQGLCCCVAAHAVLKPPPDTSTIE